jgi:hypothetical protein
MVRGMCLHAPCADMLMHVTFQCCVQLPTYLRKQLLAEGKRRNVLPPHPAPKDTRKCANTHENAARAYKKGTRAAVNAKHAASFPVRSDLGLFGHARVIEKSHVLVRMNRHLYVCSKTTGTCVLTCRVP